MMASRGAVVFGGAGFIGGHLLRRLQQAGVAPLYSVDLLAPAVTLPGICYLYHDAEDLTELALEAPVDLAFDLVTPLAKGGDQNAAFSPQARARDTAGAISAFLRRHQIRRLVHLSSTAVYGHGGGVVSEQSLPDPRQPIGWAQWRAEGIYRSWQAETGARHRLVICRAGAIFGAGGAGLIEGMAQNMARGAAIFYPARKDLLCPCYYVEDLIDALFYALAQDEADVVFNACYPEKLSLGDITAVLKAQAFPAAREVVLPWAVVMIAGVMRGGRGSGSGEGRADFAAQHLPHDVVPAWLNARGQARSGGLQAGVQAWIAADPGLNPRSAPSSLREWRLPFMARAFRPNDR